MKKLKLTTMTAMAFPALLCACPVWAQDIGDEPTSQPEVDADEPFEPSTAAVRDIDEIVVTATRQATNLQDTPIAITAITAEGIEARGITSVAEISSVAPNTQFKKSQGAFGPGVEATIRGIGNRDTGLASEPVVAFYLDDVYYPILLGSNFDLLEIDHIEVLRGPQGTLFGRNSLAGAVNIVSRQPSTSEAYGRLQATGGAYGRLEVRGSMNLPLSDQAALSVSALSKRRTGYQDVLDFTCDVKQRGMPELAGSFPFSNILNSETAASSPDDCVIGHQGGEDVQAIRASLLYEATPDISITVTGDYLRDTSENAADYILEIDEARVNRNAQTVANYFGISYDSRFVTGDPFKTYATYSDPIAAGTVIPGSPFYNGLRVDGTFVRGGASFDPRTDLKNWGASGKLSWDISNNINLLAVVARRELVENQTYDDDGSPLNLVLRSGDVSEKYWTAEARLSGQSDLIDWVLGAFYFTAEGLQEATFISTQIGIQNRIYSEFDPTSKAVFANATVRPFGEKLGIVLGARYSDDKKVVDFNNLRDNSPNPGDTQFDITVAQKQFDWKAGLNYIVSPDVLLYASAATGNSLPGFNARPLQPSQVFQFDGNDDIAYELGAKLDLFDGRVRLNVAAFYTDFNNRPTSISGSEALLGPDGTPVPGNRVLVPLPGGPEGSTQCGGTLPGNTGVTCIGRTYFRNQPATIRGFEAEYTINPIDNLVINGSLGYSKFKAPESSERAVNQRQDSPFWTANAGVQYTIEAEAAIGGDITPRLDWIYQSSEVVSGTTTKFNELLGARSVFNARITYDNYEHDFSISAGATNLFDKTYFFNVFDSQAFGNPYSQAQPAPPRQWYVTVEKRF